MRKTKWVIGDRIKINDNYTIWREITPTARYDGVIRKSPDVSDEGVILHIDEQGDAWVDFGDGEPDGWILNPSWADVCNPPASDKNP